MVNFFASDSGSTNERSDDSEALDQIWPNEPFMPSGESYSQMKFRVLESLKEVEMGLENLSKS